MCRMSQAIKKYLPGSSTVAHPAPLSMGIVQARILDWVAISSSRGSSWPRDWTSVSLISPALAGHLEVRVAQSCPTICDPMDCSTPGFPVHHWLLELTQTHVHWVGDAIQPSHPRSSRSPPVFNLVQHQGLFKWVNSSHQVVKVLEFQLQHQSCQWLFRTDFLQNGLVGSSCSPRESQESSPTSQFKTLNSLALSFLYSPILTSINDYWKNHSFD